MSRELSATGQIRWLSLSWTVAVACLKGLSRSEGVFLRTPKWKEGPRLREALRETRAETALAAGLWATGILAALAARTQPFLLGLFAWQGAVYACAPAMAWLNHRSELSARLQRRRRSEERRERLVAARPRLALAGGGAALALLGLFAVLTLGGAQPGRQHENLFEIPRQSPGTDTNPGLQPATGRRRTPKRGRSSPAAARRPVLPRRARSGSPAPARPPPPLRSRPRSRRRRRPAGHPHPHQEGRRPPRRRLGPRGPRPRPRRDPHRPGPERSPRQT